MQQPAAFSENWLGVLSLIFHVIFAGCVRVLQKVCAKIGIKGKFAYLYYILETNTGLHCSIHFCNFGGKDHSHPISTVIQDFVSPKNYHYNSMPSVCISAAATKHWF